MMLINWGFRFQDSANVIVWTNLGQVGYDFGSSALPQMITVMALLALFLVVGILVEGRSTTAFAVMFRRKKIIFPFRLYTFFFNFLMTCTCMELLYLTNHINDSNASIVEAFICLVFLLIGFIGIVIKLNFSPTKIEDPRFYALAEKQTSSKKRLKNQIVFSLLTRAAIIGSFVGSFAYPSTAQILILCFQSVYTLYYIIFVRLTKLRYFLINLFSNFLLLAQLTSTTQFAKTFRNFGSEAFGSAAQISWLICLLIYITVFVAALTIELISGWMQLKRQIRSVYVRFILCEKEEQEVPINPFDDNYNKSRVTEFVQNPLHSKVRPLVLDDGL